MSAKRTDYITWDQYFMGVALLSAQRSKDPSTQVGSCIVDGRRRIVAIGYSGFPTGCSDDEFPWEREGAFLETKYPYVCHAELNAILNRNAADISGSTIYTTLHPCNECAKAIVQSGIAEVVYLSDKHRDSDGDAASRRILELAGVRTRKFTERLAIVLRHDPDGSIA
jgi:dCMP deaminase